MTIEKGKAGPKPKEINWQLFEDLCSLQCTQSEIASVLHCHVDTVRDRASAYYGEDYSNVYKRFSEGGKSSLRRYQFNLAKKNTTMAIFLGKQWLGQKDNDQVAQVPAELMINCSKLMTQLAAAQAKASNE